MCKRCAAEGRYARGKALAANLTLGPRPHAARHWAHQTGHNESRGYGTKAREWQLNTVALTEDIERPEAEIAFGLKFTKAESATPIIEPISTRPS